MGVADSGAENWSFSTNITASWHNSCPPLRDFLLNFNIKEGERQK
jgi:ABC-type proline/glycine betaine transport system substrate-binding protein